MKSIEIEFHGLSGIGSCLVCGAKVPEADFCHLPGRMAIARGGRSRHNFISLFARSDWRVGQHTVPKTEYQQNSLLNRSKYHV